MMVCYNLFLLGFDDIDSIYASPEDFKDMKNRDRARGAHLLEYFVTRCHEIGVLMCFFFGSVCVCMLYISFGSVFVFVLHWIK
jgi:hypothetical protein